MNKMTLLLWLWPSLLCVELKAQSKTTPLETVQAQLDAYNKQDIDAFSQVFAPDVMVYQSLGDSLPWLKGRDAVYERYKTLFEKYPKNYSTLTGRVIQGNFVIDHEYVTGRENPTRIVAIYEVMDGLIVRCWFVR
jgi:hypothetical protein